MLKKGFFAIGVLIIGVSFIPTTTTAQQRADVLKNVCEERPNAAACRDRNPAPGEQNNPLFGREGVLTEIINLASILIGIAAVIMIIVGGFKFIASGNNPQDVAGAREVILYAIVGLVLAAVAQLIVQFVLARI